MCALITKIVWLSTRLTMKGSQLRFPFSKRDKLSQAYDLSQVPFDEALRINGVCETCVNTAVATITFPIPLQNCGGLKCYR